MPREARRRARHSPTAAPVPVTTPACRPDRNRRPRRAARRAGPDRFAPPRAPPRRFALELPGNARAQNCRPHHVARLGHALGLLPQPLRSARSARGETERSPRRGRGGDAPPIGSPRGAKSGARPAAWPRANPRRRGPGPRCRRLGRCPAVRENRPATSAGRNIAAPDRRPRTRRRSSSHPAAAAKNLLAGAPSGSRRTRLRPARRSAAAHFPARTAPRRSTAPAPDALGRETTAANT